MPGKYHIDTTIDIPIYRQLADEIGADIKKGVLAKGYKLPTVQELSEELSLARGTVKRCYDELERRGFIEKVQGRGTFVSLESQNPGSRKDAAMAAIDEMFRTLEKLNFSETETNIFINLKLRERENDSEKVKVAVVGSCRELLTQMTRSLRTNGKAELYSYVFEDVAAYPYKMSEEADVIAVQDELFEQLRASVPDTNKLMRVCLLPDKRSLVRMAGLSGDLSVCAASREFCEKIGDFCGEYAQNIHITEDADTVLAPDEYERFCRVETAERLAALEKEGRLVRCGFEPDKGSFAAIRERIDRLSKEKHL